MTDAVYEMLWDCKYCGQKKLLGLTHRFCAGCGAPQDPAARYFPADHEKVPVHAHPYVGADVACPACRQPMSRAAKCCTSCGGPLDRGAEVARRADVVMPPGGGWPPPTPMGMAAVAPPPPAKSRGLVFGIVGGVLAVVVGLVLVAIFWKREGVFEVRARLFCPVSALIRLDLPTFERPAIAISGHAAGGSWSSLATPMTKVAGRANSRRPASMLSGSS